MEIQNTEQKKDMVRKSIAIGIFLITNIIVFLIYLFDLIDYINSSKHPLTDSISIESFATLVLIIGTSIFFTAIYLPKKWISKIFATLEIIILILIIIFLIIDDGYYSVEAHIRRILYGFLAGYGIVFLEYHLFRFLLNIIFSKQSNEKNTSISMVMSEKEDSNIQQSWKDRFLKKIFRGISTFSFIPLVASIIAPMITYLLPVAYSIYYLLGIPSTDVMQGIVKFGEETLFTLIIHICIVQLYFIGSGILILSIVTMAKERKKGQFNLIQHGFYTRIRHPQNLVISLIILLMFFSRDSGSYGGLDTGHMISWGVFTLFLKLESLIEEKHLLKKFPDQYWIYMQKTGFFHPKLRKAKQIPPKLPESESTYFRRKIIFNVVGFLIFFILIFSVVKILIYNNSDLIKFRNPFRGGGMYPDHMIINEIMVVLVPIGIWLVSFIITIVHYLKEKVNKNASGETEKEQSVIFTKLRAILFWIFVIFLLIEGYLIYERLL
ncbi:MAG: methyltransferase family protein [Promethearchaeota archaeon]